MEEAFVPIEGAEKTTRPKMGDPIAKARHRPQGKVRQTSLRYDRDLEQTTTRQGDPIAKTQSTHQEGGARAFDPIED